MPFLFEVFWTYFAEANWLVDMKGVWWSCPEDPCTSFFTAKWPFERITLRGHVDPWKKSLQPVDIGHWKNLVDMVYYSLRSSIHARWLARCLPSTGVRQLTGELVVWIQRGCFKSKEHIFPHGKLEIPGLINKRHLYVIYLEPTWDDSL